MVAKYLIVGAGYSGLQLAQGLNQHAMESVRILEKSKGVGGRLATRREGQFTFDHGAQFIKSFDLNSRQLDKWRAEGILNPLSNGAYCVFGGMTRIAKDLAKNLDITFECKAMQISNTNNIWKVTTDKETSFEGQNLILSCPLPQSLELLSNSNLSFDKSLKDIKYAKAIVFLIKDERIMDSMKTYREPASTSVFSVASQFKKGTSILPAWTITMTPRWSEEHFERSDEEILAAAQNEIYAELPHISIDDVIVKKWRYSHPLETYKSSFFLEIQKGLYLIGDAFGGASLNGAHRSAHALLKHFESL